MTSPATGRSSPSSAVTSADAAPSAVRQRYDSKDFRVIQRCNHAIFVIALLVICVANMAFFQPIMSEVSLRYLRHGSSPDDAHVLTTTMPSAAIVTSALQRPTAAATVAAAPQPLPPVANTSSPTEAPPTATPLPPVAKTSSPTGAPPTETPRSPVTEEPSTMSPSSAALLPQEASGGNFLANATNSSSEQPPPVPVSFCLLIMDDNDILAEWVAYHYHVVNMRRLIVAVDPYSKTSPLDVLQAWGPEGGTGGGGGGWDLEYTLWNDEDYMSEAFWKDKDYSGVPSNSWHLGGAPEKQRVDNHRFRQRTFVSQCYARLKAEGRTWVAHIDTDEFLVVNPMLRSEGQSQGGSDAAGKRNETAALGSNEPEAFSSTVPVPKTPTAGSLSVFLGALYSKDRATGYRPHTCLMIPRVLFGSREDIDLHYTLADDGQIMLPLEGVGQQSQAATNNSSINQDPTGPSSSSSSSSSSPPSNSSSLWWYKSLETLRWEYHNNLTSNNRNGAGKSLVNVATIPEDHPIFLHKAAASVHETLVPNLGGKKYACGPHKATLGVEPAWSRPISLNHYGSSLDRYMARGDIRRTIGGYNFLMGPASIHKDDGWIRGWFHHFVTEHGLEKALTVMGNHTTSSLSLAT